MPAWVLAILQHWGFKTISIVLAIALVCGSLFVVYRGVKNKYYNQGYQQALKDHPQNVFNAPATINQQPCPAPTVYGLDIGKWGFGLIHKR